MANPLSSFSRPPSRRTSVGSTRPTSGRRKNTSKRGNFIKGIQLITTGINDLRVARGTSAQLQARRLRARSKFTRS